MEMKESYAQKETMLIKITGNFITPPTIENIYFLDVNVRVPLLFDIAKIQDSYFIYAISPERPGNYTLRIKDTAYLQGTQTIKEDLKRTFAVQNQSASFNIYPGFLITTGESQVTLENFLPQALPVSFSSPFLQSQQEILSSESIKRITLSFFPERNTSFTTLQISGGQQIYELPVIFLQPEEKQETKGLRWSSPEFRVIARKNTQETRTIYVYNVGQAPFSNISLALSQELEPYITFSPSFISELPEGSGRKIELIVQAKNEGTIEGELLAETESEAFILPIILYIVSNQTYQNITQGRNNTLPIEDQPLACQEKNGVFCNTTQECIGNVEYVLEGACCLGYCQQQTQPTPLSKRFLGIVLVLIGLLTVGWFFWKQRRKY